MMKTSLSSRKQRRQLERKLIKAKRNAWHQGQKVKKRERTRQCRMNLALDSNVDRDAFTRDRRERREEEDEEEKEEVD